MKKTMEDPRKIMRRSIHTFLQNYHRATIAAALVLPFSAALLLSQAFFSSSSFHVRINTNLGFSTALDFFNMLTLKPSQTLSSSLLTLPFTLTFFLFSKAYVIKLLSNNHDSFYYYYYLPLLRVYVCNSLFLLSANASAFALFFIASFGFSSRNFYTLFSLASAIIYSIILANALVISNLALVSSTSSSSSGVYTTILKACLLLRGRTSTALALAIPTNLGLAGVKALFHYRVVRSYYKSDRNITSIAIEGMFIAYLSALFLVLDTIVSFLFYQSCVKNDEDQKIGREDEYSIKIQICETENMKICIKGPKCSQEIL